MNYSELLRGSRQFKKIEKRDIFYGVATKLIKKSKNPEDTVDALFIILLTWNKAYYRYNTFDEKHYMKLKRIIKYYDKILKSLKDFTLDEVDFNKEFTLNNKSRKAEDLIKGIYEKLVKVVGVTGASKTLHLLNPQLFMMWDVAIRKGYGCRKDGKSYVNFMKRMQLEINEAIDSYCDKYQCSKRTAIKKLSELCDNKSLPKLMDEYNYVKFSWKGGGV